MGGVFEEWGIVLLLLQSLLDLLRDGSVTTNLHRRFLLLAVAFLEDLDLQLQVVDEGVHLIDLLGVLTTTNLHLATEGRLLLSGGGVLVTHTTKVVLILWSVDLINTRPLLVNDLTAGVDVLIGTAHQQSLLDG